MRPPQIVPPRPQMNWGRSGCFVVLAVGLGLVGLVFALSSWRTVDSGTVGVTRSFGKITGTRQAGGFFVQPIGFSMVSYDLRVVSQIEKQEAALRNQQTLFVNRAAYQYNLTPDAARVLLERIGRQETFENIVVIPKLQNAIKAVTPNYQAAEVFSKRSEMERQMEATLAEDLAVYGVDKESVDITLADIAFSEEYQQSINAKAKAEQDKLVEEANLDKQLTQSEREILQSRTNAEKAKQEAIGEANAARERAKGEADATRFRAEAEARANNEIRESLTPELINYRYAQNWNGQLPSTVLGQSGATPLVGLPVTSTTPSPDGSGQTKKP